MKIYSWNVNGIRAVERKQLLPWQQITDADIWCLQETKAHKEQVSPAVAEPEGWHSHWCSADKRGYSGTAIYSRIAPDEVVTGINDERFDSEGRVISARFDELLVVSAYFPNSQELGRRLDYKLAFCQRLEARLAEWRREGCQILLCGDYNIAHQAIDLARPGANEQSPGYLPEERAWMSHYLGLGYHDVFREEHPELTGAYSWWSYRSAARAKNIGWRIDYCTTCPALRLRARDAHIHAEIQGSDHCPVSIDIDD